MTVMHDASFVAQQSSCLKVPIFASRRSPAPYRCSEALQRAFLLDFPKV